MMPDRSLDPALRLLLEAGEETGSKALLMLAGEGPLAAAFAPRFAEVHCHNAYHPQHAAAMAAMRAAGLAHVRCLLGDIPCAWRNGDAAGTRDPSETMLSALNYPEGSFDCVVFRLGRGTALVNAALTEAFLLLKKDGVLLVAGHNQEGIKSFARRAEAHFGGMEILAIKSGCRLLRFRKESSAPVEAVEDPRYFHPIVLELPYAGPGGGGRIPYLTKPGIFAYRATDPGTAFLAGHLPSCAGKSVLDLGCGSGALSLAAFALGAADVLATDTSAIAIACTERNFAEKGVAGRTLCANLAEGAAIAAQGPGAAEGFDLVLTNPPFHKDGETDYGLPGRVLEAIHRSLRPGGEAYLVSNQFLDYPALARKTFAETSLIARDQSYTIHRMVKAQIPLP
jgi:16S rRNA (guanine1207-N2)-methyltransferase